MAKKYRVTVFGKKGCDKCKVLKERFDSLLSKEEWSDFEQDYRDVETEQGLISFVKLEALNPQRIPAFVVEKLDPATGRYAPLLNTAGGEGQVQPWRFIGVQTDYSEKGRGVITPKMVVDTLARAKEL